MRHSQPHVACGGRRKGQCEFRELLLAARQLAKILLIQADLQEQRDRAFTAAITAVAYPDPMDRPWSTQVVFDPRRLVLQGVEEKLARTRVVATIFGREAGVAAAGPK